MNQKIQCLIDGGFISTNDVMEHAGYLENQINEYYERYGEWECGAGTLHPPDVTECECFKCEEEQANQDLYGQDGPEDYDYPFDITNNRSDDPEYIIASTSYKMEETYIFEADKDGEILDFGEYGGLCYRHGDYDWMNRNMTVQSVFPDKYHHVKDLDPIGENVFQSLYKRNEI